MEDSRQQPVTLVAWQGDAVMKASRSPAGALPAVYHVRMAPQDLTVSNGKAIWVYQHFYRTEDLDNQLSVFLVQLLLHGLEALTEGDWVLQENSTQLY